MNIAETVRAILLRDWDPLVVGGNRYLTDEYDDYIPGAVRLIENDCSTEQLQTYLEDIERGWGTEPGPGAALAAKNILAAVRAAR
jgi:hypothetical protein